MTKVEVARRAAAIGAGLAEARAARAIPAGERIHVVGAAGAGASAAALLASHAGARVTGCDAGGASPYTRALAALGVPIASGHDAAHVTSDGRTPLVDRLAVTKALTAIAPDHPELAAARSLGLTIEPWQQVVADVAVGTGARLVAVAGTHGKSTSAGWLTALLAWAGRDPSAFVGAQLPAWLAGGIPATARWGRGPEFVVEADEYAGNFDSYRPALTVLLNADWDHPDVFPDREAVVEAFEGWIRRSAGAAGESDGAGGSVEADMAGAADMPAAAGTSGTAGAMTGAERAATGAGNGPTAPGALSPPALVVNVGDPGAARVAERLAGWPGRLVVVALAGDIGAPAGSSLVDQRAALARRYRSALGPAHGVVGRIVREEPDGTELEIAGLSASGEPGALRVRILLAGRHNAANGLAVAAGGWALGLPSGPILDALGRFEGVGRRLELKGEVGGVAVLDDYGHHPTAIAATLAAVRQRYPGRRTWAVYEPLTFHRTAAMLDQFAAVLATADEAVVTSIWAGRDPDTTIVSAADLAAAIRARGGPHASAPGAIAATTDYLARRVRPGDVVLVMGGGHSYRIAEDLVRALRAATPSPASGPVPGPAAGER